MILRDCWRYGNICVFSLEPLLPTRCLFFFFNDPATPEIHPFPLHDALPICSATVDAIRSGAQFGEQGWRCLLPELGLVLQTLPSESDLPAQPILTDATRAKVILEQGMRAEIGRAHV